MSHERQEKQKGRISEGLKCPTVPKFNIVPVKSVTHQCGQKNYGLQHDMYKINLRNLVILQVFDLFELII